jgi:hypothetical protein
MRATQRDSEGAEAAAAGGSVTGLLVTPRFAVVRDPPWKPRNPATRIHEA